jgi:glycosyltransferase involved in cell wall biosynthesis
MSEFLNKKWPNFIVDHIPNGFFNASGKQIEFIFKKENIILTVGRIGTDQKANNILIMAFSTVFNELPGWKLCLAGPVQEAFRKSADEYIEKIPNLKSRIEFLGNITDKEKLYGEYAKAKIFALTSVSEGGAPNVVAEALFHGCYTVTSDVDAAKDITDNGNCGQVFPLFDVKALAAILLKTCRDENLLQKAPQKSISFAKRHYDWDLIVNRVNHLMFSENAAATAKAEDTFKLALRPLI